MKIVKVPYKNEQVEIEIDDQLNFGAIEDITKKYVKGSGIGKDAEIDIVGYRYAITSRALKKAPWKVGDINDLKDLPIETGRAVVKEVTKIYPLRTCLMDWMGSALGEIGDKQIEKIQNLLDST